MGLINIGYGNYVNSAMLLSVVRADSAPVKRMIQGGKDDGSAVDATQGRKTKSVILLKDNRMVLSALMPETLAQRLNAAGTQADEDLQEGMLT